MSYVVKNRGRWYAVLYEGVDPITGRDRRRWQAAADENAAYEVAATMRRAERRGTGVECGATVARYLTGRWLPAKEPTLRATTFHRYQRSIAVYVVPRIGRVPLRRLTARHLERLYADLLTSGRIDRDGGLAPKTVLNVHQILRKALSDAVRKGLVARNVALAVDPPRLEQRAEQRAWTAEQLRWFLDCARGHRLFAALWLAATTGMRRGEVIGLRWCDVDLAAGTLSVHHSISCAGYQLCETNGKTRNARRVIDLDAATVEVLAAWRTQQVSELGPISDSYVFTRPDGRVVHPHLLSQAFDRLVAAAGVPRIRLHDLRVRHEAPCIRAG